MNHTCSIDSPRDCERPAASNAEFPSLPGRGEGARWRSPMGPRTAFTILALATVQLSACATGEDSADVAPGAATFTGQGPDDESGEETGDEGFDAERVAAMA